MDFAAFFFFWRRRCRDQRFRCHRCHRCWGGFPNARRRKKIASSFFFPQVVASVVGSKGPKLARDAAAGAHIDAVLWLLEHRAAVDHSMVQAASMDGHVSLLEHYVAKGGSHDAVSYTHLTLPTILLV